MIVVKVELWKGGNPNDVQPLGRMDIFNDLTGDRTRGNYGVRLYRRDGLGSKVLRAGKVFNYPRLSYSVWELVRRALKTVES